MVQRNALTLSSSSGAALRKHRLHRREDLRWEAFRFTTHSVACVAVPGTSLQLAPNHARRITGRRPLDHFFSPSSSSGSPGGGGRLPSYRAFVARVARSSKNVVNPEHRGIVQRPHGWDVCTFRVLSLRPDEPRGRARCAAAAAYLGHANCVLPLAVGGL
eukprot:gene16629-biopygen14338